MNKFIVTIAREPGEWSDRKFRVFAPSEAAARNKFCQSPIVSVEAQ